MKIAVLSDIHGNDIALKSVLEEAQRLGIRHLFILGDIVGYYYRADRVIELLEAWPRDMVQGNHEAMLEAVRGGRMSGEEIRRNYGSGIISAMERMEGGRIQYLVEMPVHKRICVDGLRFFLCHGSPWERDEYIYPDASADILRKCASEDSDFVFMGHTHYPFVYSHQGTLIVNVGSVGQARDKGGMASWAVVDTFNRALVLKHTNYDASSIIEEVKAIDPHLPYLHEILTRNASQCDCRAPRENE
jgi:putative phosphoesterase